jgi:hypothetical protein
MGFKRIDTPPMNPEVKQEWIAALRSGEYKQGSEFLRRGDEFCCLGVLCDLHAKKTSTQWLHGFKGSEYLDNKERLPEAVSEWAGLQGHNSNDPYMKGNWLSAYNDDEYKSFSEIADLIEKHL